MRCSPASTRLICAASAAPVLVALACAPSAPPTVAYRPADTRSDEALPSAPPPVAAPPSEPRSCSDALGLDLARVSCDQTRFVVAHPIELHPDRATPEPATREVLRRVSEIMHERDDVLLVRIEVSLASDPGPDPARRRAALAGAQRRADALLQYLWRKRGVSAERLEAVGYEHDPRRAQGGAAFPVVLRIVQSARR